MSSDRDRRLPIAFICGLVAALAGPVLWSVLTTTEHSSGDVALIELRVRDVLSTDPGLVGAYSRFGWWHPGPLMFDVFAVPYRLFGGDTDALRLTAVLFNAVVISATVWLASRRGMAAMVWSAVAIVGLVWGMDARSLADAWNVTVAVVPMVLIVVACWSALVGDDIALIVAVVSFSFVFQSHVGFGVVAAPLVVGTAGWCTRVAWRARARDRRSRRTVRIAAGCFVVTFLLPIYDVLVHWPGNLGRLISWSVDHDQQTVGLGDGFRVIGRASSLTFLRHPQASTFFFTVDVDDVGLLPGLVIALLLGSLVLSWHRRWRAERLLCTTIVVLWVSGVIAAANIAEPLEVWLIQWTRPLAWMSWSTVVLVGWRVLQGFLASRRPSGAGVSQRLGRGILAASLGVMVIGTVTYARATVEVRPDDAARHEAVSQLAADAGSIAAAGPVDLDVDSDDDVGRAQIMMAGVVNVLDRRGYDVCVAPEFEYQYGPGHVCDGTPRQHLLLRSEENVRPAPEDAQIVGMVDTLSASERHEADSLTRDLADLLTVSDLAEQVPLLETTFVDALLGGTPPPAIESQRANIERLDELRSRDNGRYGLYILPS